MSFDGEWDAEAVDTAPFKTRIVVFRPRNAAAFNGTVVVCWNNVSAGYDIFDGPSPELLGGGYAFVAARPQRVGVHGLPTNPLGLVSWDPERYGTLSIPTDDYSFDIFTQVATAVGPDRPRTGPDPLGGLDVRHVVAQGSSQSAGRLATYINALHRHTHAVDAYQLLIYMGFGLPLEVGDDVIDLSGPEKNPGPELRAAHRLRELDDARVMVVNSELEARVGYPVRQPDTDRYRNWEVAGACHVSAQAAEARAPKLERDFGSAAAGLFAKAGAWDASPEKPGPNQVPMAPVNDAALHQLHSRLDDGTPPPAQARIELTGNPPEVARDEHGLATGGVRLPQVDMPVATNSSIPLGGDLFAILCGSCVPFTPEKVLELYGRKATYLARFQEAARDAERRGVLLPRDAEALLEEARSRAFP